MASLQSSFTVLSTTPKPRTSAFRKPSRARVSCNGGNSGGGRVDRRNMLLGLGGLYGASSLVSGRKAEADPIQPPNLEFCDHEGTTTIDRLTGRVIRIDADCCPPYTDTITDYVLPRFPTIYERQGANMIVPDPVAKYKLAIQRMKQLDKDDPNDPRGFTQQANIHCAYCNGPYDQVGYPTLDIQIHNNWLFFPFHRWYLYFFERICCELLEDDTFRLPYWNWDHPYGMYLPTLFGEAYSPLYDCNRDQTHFGNALVDLSFVEGVSVDANLNQMQQEMMVQPDSALAFMGQPYRAGDPPPGGASGGTSERGSHAGIHVWTGNPDNPLNENMGNFYSAARDPIFYCHHANVDRMWTVWEDLPADYPKTIDDPDFLDAAFMFYDEKKNLVRVKVRDCLDTTRLGYAYRPGDIRPWRFYRPPTREVPANVQQLSETAQTAAQAFPASLAETIRVVVPKPAKGKADEVLLIQGIVTDSSKLISFDVYVNDDENSADEAVSAERAGSFTQVPHRSRSAETPSDLRIILTELYKNINIADDDDIVVVTIVPRTNGDAVTIGGVKIETRVPAA